MKVLFQKGNRLFTATWLFVIVAAIGHTGALVGDLPDDEGLSAAIDAMDAYTFDTADSTGPSLLDVFVSAWIQIGLLMAGMALVNLVVVAFSGGDMRIKRPLLIADVVVFGALTGLFVIFPILPALFICAATTILLVVTLIFSRDATGESEG